MKTLILYSPDDGHITQKIQPAPASDVPNGFVPEGLSALILDDDIDANEYYILDGVLTQKPQSEKEAEAREGAWRDLRIRRSSLLRNKIDSINAVRWDVMKEPERRAWREYRQALLDLPENTTDPFDPPWPTLPSKEQIGASNK